MEPGIDKLIIYQKLINQLLLASVSHWEKFSALLDTIPDYADKVKFLTLLTVSLNESKLEEIQVYDEPGVLYGTFEKWDNLDERILEDEGLRNEALKRKKEALIAIRNRIPFLIKEYSSIEKKVDDIEGDENRSTDKQFQETHIDPDYSLIKFHQRIQEPSRKIALIKILFDTLNAIPRIDVDYNQFERHFINNGLEIFPIQWINYGTELQIMKLFQRLHSEKIILEKHYEYLIAKHFLNKSGNKFKPFQLRISQQKEGSNSTGLEFIEPLIKKLINRLTS